jgi:hypothetical protein
MKKTILLSLLTASVITVKSQITPSLTIPNPIPEYNGSYENFGQHHFFYPNNGEVRYADSKQSSAISEVSYYTKNTYPRQYLLKNNNISFIFAKRDTTTGSPIDSLHRIDLEMDRSNSSAFLARIDTQNTCVLNYFTQFFNSTGRTDVRGGASIAIQSIYPNIDMVYTSNNTGLKIYYIVYPGGDPNNIIFHFKGTNSNSLVGNKLQVDANWSNITFDKPKMYQYTYINNVVTPVNVCPASWVSIGSDRYKITTSTPWNSSLPLIIQVRQGVATQPTVGNNLKWSTYFGGGLQDYIYKTKSDASNNLFVAGQTISADFPQNTNATPLQATNLAYDGFLSKFSPSGILQWSTFFGGSSSELIKDFDFSGSDAYCIGFTSSFNLPILSKSGAFNDNSFAGGYGDGFILQIDRATGGTNSWSTYFGGNKDDEFRGCKFDSNGAFFVVGSSNSTNLSLVGSGGMYQQTYNSAQQPSTQDIHDAIIMKFNATTSAMDWFTFYGTDVLGTNANSNSDDEFWGIDISGTDVYACGKAGGTNLPSSINTKILAGYPDGIIAKFSTGGVISSAKYTNGNILNNSIKINNNKVYTCGLGKNGMTTVNSSVFYYDNTCASGDFDACFSVHTLNLTTTLHNTFLGGTGNDQALDLQFAPNGVFYISGETRASNFPIVSLSNTYNNAHNGNTDNFLCAFAEFNTSIIWSTCLGSPGEETDQQDEALSISIDGQNFLHLGGTTNSYNLFPVDNGGGIPYYQPVRSGGSLGFSNDATITRFDLTPLNTVVGLKELQNKVELGIYPNPTANILNLNNAELENSDLNYSVYTTEGKKIIDGKLSAKEDKNLNVKGLENGIYLLKLNVGAKTYNGKFVKSSE